MHKSQSQGHENTQISCALEEGNLNFEIPSHWEPEFKNIKYLEQCLAHRFDN